MILNNSPTDQAILSNVGEIGEFRIRNSAKAFNILSSGLYANKIRAIIRELSCNAIDSHIAANKQSTPFDVHLPTQLEPWFAIRDYGTGLNHDEVTNIYTTYFESTKTESNDFTGALGLGSKSPFSYTDNFMVTSVKDGRRGIYSAFINDKGVPSIALMSEEATNDPNGVEVKFSVNNTADYYKFIAEAKEVYSYFKLRPVVGGVSQFEFKEIKYHDRDVVPGVHTMNSHGTSIAVMGNIAYPIMVPNAGQNLGNLSDLLSCNLEINFEISEVDFQASREGLSYIPSTIEAIKKKLEALNGVLAIKLTSEANAITNLWERADFLRRKQDQRLWRAAAEKYVADTKFPLIDITNGYFRAKVEKLFIDDLEKKYNIELHLYSSKDHTGVYTGRPQQDWHSKDANGKTREVWSIAYEVSYTFVKNDLKRGALVRTKYHMRNLRDNKRHNYIVVTAKDSTKPVLFDEFFKDIYSPSNVMLASNLKERPKQTVVRSNNTVSILKLEHKGQTGRRYSDEMVWRDAGEIDDLNDDSKTYLYLPLVGFEVISQYGHTDAKWLHATLINSNLFNDRNIVLYGVRKTYLEKIKKYKNWVNLDEHIANVLTSKCSDIEHALVLQKIDNRLMYMNQEIVNNITDPKSMFKRLADMVGRSEPTRYEGANMNQLFSRYLKRRIDTEKLYEKIAKQVRETNQCYPLLKYIENRVGSKDIVDYVNMVDRVKNV